MLNIYLSKLATICIVTSAFFVFPSCEKTPESSSAEMMPIPDSENMNGPTAENIRANSDPSLNFTQVPLMGSDSDGDSLSYVLMSDRKGSGYRDAYVDPDQGVLYVTFEGDESEITLGYAATDGKTFSDVADVTITREVSEQTLGGRQEEDPQTYAAVPQSNTNGNVSGSAGGEATLPSAVDLTPLVPVPGDQGHQSSCVGWAVAYAAKSYQEGIEEGWPLNQIATTFSPAYIYNQINRGVDRGSFPTDALELIVNQGAATLATMPYNPSDFRSQPPPSARQEAAGYKARSYKRVSTINSIKNELANRRPVVVGVPTFQSFLNLRGSNSVYHFTNETNLGGHAVTIIGYDDQRFGGSFKLINSWGTDWGDEGYFYIPYEDARPLIDTALVLEDGPNSGSQPVTDQPYRPPAPSDGPDLSVVNWQLSSNTDLSPGGFGQLIYEVVNAGTDATDQPFDISLLLTTGGGPESIVATVVYEQVPFQLPSGASVFRNENNAIGFQIPNVPDGNYIFTLWADDLDAIDEQDENNNFSRAERSAPIQSRVGDLETTYWYADGDSSGNSVLEYVVTNVGGGSINTSNWDISLALTQSYDFSRGTYVVFQDQGRPLQSGQNVSRSFRNGSGGHFNVNFDINGNRIPDGEYLVAFVADAFQNVPESSEGNNVSFAQRSVFISSQRSSKTRKSQNSSSYEAESHESGKSNASMSKPFFNGHSLGQLEVAIFTDDKDTKQMRLKKNSVTPENSTNSLRVIAKSADSMIFPISQRIPMTDASDQE